MLTLLMTGPSLSNSRSDTFKTTQPGHIQKSTQPWMTTLTSEKIRSFLGHLCIGGTTWEWILKRDGPSLNWGCTPKWFPYSDLEMLTYILWLINYESLFMTNRRYFLRFEILVYMLPRKNTSVHNLVIIKNDYDSILNNNHYQCIYIVKSFEIFETLETKSKL